MTQSTDDLVKRLERMLDMRSDEYYAALDTIERLQRDLRECVELLERGRAAINHVGVVTGADEWTEQCDALLARLKGKP